MSPKTEQDVDTLARKGTPKVLAFHVLQGFNYVLACAFFAYLALHGSEAKPEIVSKLWMKLEDPPLNPLERTLLAMFWLSPFCIGLGYILLAKHLESVYGSFLTAFMGGTLTFRVLLTPAQYLTLIIVPVDFGGLLYKLSLFREEFWAIPKHHRRFLWNVPEKKDRSMLSRLLELESYAFAAYAYALSFASTDVLLPGSVGSRVSPFSKIFFVTQAVIFVFAVPGLRQGKVQSNIILIVNKLIVSYFLTKGIFFDNVVPNAMGVYVLLPYAATLAFELHLLLWKSVMRYSIFSKYVTKRQASSAKYFSMLFAVVITTVSNVWYVFTGTGLGSISKTYGGFLERLAFLPGKEESADRARFLDVMLAGVLFLFVLALEEVLAKKNTAKIVSKIHFLITMAVAVQSFMMKVLTNLEITSPWHGVGLTSDDRVGIHCTYWVVNVFLRVLFPLVCVFILANVDGPISSWTIAMRIPKNTKSHLASTIVIQNKIRTAVRRTMIFHGIGILMFASVASSLFTSGLPTFYPHDGLFGGGYIVEPLIPHSTDTQRSLFYVSLVIAFTTVIMGTALASINGRALPLAQFVSAVWPLSTWAFLIDSWVCLAYQRESKLPQYVKPLFAGTNLANSEHLTSVAVVGIGTAMLSLIIIAYLKVRAVSVYNRKVQAPSDFAEELSHSHKQSYLFHGSVLVLMSSTFMLRSCRETSLDAIGGIFTEFLFDDMVACMMMMNFGFVIYECKDALQHRSFLSKVVSLKSSWILSGYALFLAHKALHYFGTCSKKVELVHLASYVFYNLVIQIQSARAVLTAIRFIRPNFNSNLPAILKSFHALSKVEAEGVDAGLVEFVKRSSHFQTPTKNAGYAKGKLTKGDPNWENNWAKHYIDNFGEKVYSEASASQFPIPMPPPDEADLKKQQGKAAFTFMLAASVFHRRPTHPVGVGAYGMFEVIENKEIPPTDFFVPGKIFHMRCRHSNGVGVQTKGTKIFDDAALEVRSLSIKLAKGRDDSPFDLNLNTGEFAGFFNLPSFREFVYMSTMNDQKLFDQFAAKYPSCLMAEVDGFRRSPETFAQLHYYSQTCRSFNSLDGKRRYCKFRAVPYGKGPHTEVEPEPFKPDDEDQKRIVTKPMMSHHRLDDERRPTDYLRNEFRNRVSAEVVRYRLQIQLYEWKAGDTDEVFNANKAWGTPFLDLGVITLHTPMNDWEVEQTSFNIANCPRCISLVKPVNAHDYHTINWTRRAVYGKSSKIRRYFTMKRQPFFERPCRYVMDFHTSHVVFSGIDGNVSVTLVGTRGSTTEMFLENSAYDFEVDTVSRFVSYDEDIGEPLYMFVTHDAEATLKRKLYNLDLLIPDKWNLGKVQVTSRSPIYGERRTNFYVWRWLSKGELVFALADNIQEDYPKVKQILPQMLAKYFQNKKSVYDWSSGASLPNHLSAKKHGDLPEEEQFSSMKLKDFAVSAVEGLRNQRLVGLYFQDREMTSFEEYHRCLVTLPPYPPIERWHEDEEWGRQLMNGTHPVIFMRCSKIPSKFGVTDATVKGLLPPGRTLQEELDAGHIFILDYAIVEGIPCPEGRHCAAGLGLLHACEGSPLRPIAIQLHQDGGPVWTPKDRPLEWLLAKMHLTCADANIHEMVTHLFACHLLMEPWAVALERNLPSYHPVFRLLKPHLQYTIAINTIGRNTLIAKDGVSDKILSIGQGGHIDIMAKAYTYFRLYHLDLPEMLSRRGVTDRNVLPDYYWRDDSLKIWNALSKYATSVLTQHYQGSDLHVRRDQHVQNLIRDMKFNGYWNEDPDYHGVPDAVDSIKELAKLCTMVMFQTSCMHSSVNFSQFDYYSYVPNRPLTMRRPPPRRKGEVTEADIFANLPNSKGCARSIAATWALSQFSDEEVFLGYPKMETMDLEYQRKATEDFRRELREIERGMRQRNQKLERGYGYEYLLPSSLPESIAI